MRERKDNGQLSRGQLFMSNTVVRRNKRGYGGRIALTGVGMWGLRGGVGRQKGQQQAGGAAGRGAGLGRASERANERTSEGAGSLQGDGLLLSRCARCEP